MSKAGRNASYVPGPWEREDRTIYALMSDGYWKGGEQFKNRLTIHVSFDREVGGEEALATLDLITAAPELFEALRDVLRIAKAASTGVAGNAARIAKAENAIWRALGQES